VTRIHAVLTTGFIIMAFLAGIIFTGLYTAPVKAAPPATSDNCTLVATVEGINTYYCEPDQGQPFKQNSAGFMLNED
jgi:hypothetical protein